MYSAFPVAQPGAMEFSYMAVAVAVEVLYLGLYQTRNFVLDLLV